MPTPDLLSTRQVAETLGIDVSTISRWVKEGRMTFAMRLPGKSGAMLFSPSEVEKQRTALQSDEVAS